MRSDPFRTGEPQLAFRELESDREYAACLELQKTTWGEDFAELVPLSILLVARKTGGLVAGALDEAGQLLGFVFGVAGWKGGEPFHWSHMLAVRREARGRGIGRRLKLLQREILLERGVKTAYWSYDPLVAKNAYLNLERLGVEVVEYVDDMYGRRTASPLHGDLGTDRLVVRWRLGSDRVARVLVGRRHPPPFPDAPAVLRMARDERPADSEVPDEVPALRIEVPRDFERLIRERPDEAAEWRRAARRAFHDYLDRGYRVAAFRREPDPPSYVLVGPTPTSRT